MNTSGHSTSGDASSIERLRDQTLHGLHERLENLPVLPRVVVALLGLDSGGPDYLREVGALVGSDPTLTARLLRAANNPAHAPLSPITSLSMAISRLGALQVAEWVTSMALIRLFNPSTDGQRNLWRHCLQVAIVTRFLATSPQCSSEPPPGGDRSTRPKSTSTWYTTALLHDIGRFVLFVDSPAELGLVDELSGRCIDDLIEAEQALCGFDHATLGWLACKRWGLPNNLCGVVRAHHADAPERLRNSDPELIRAIQLADRLSVAILSEQLTLEPQESALDTRIIALALPGLPDSGAESLADALPSLAEEWIRLFSVLGVD